MKKHKEPSNKHRLIGYPRIRSLDRGTLGDDDCLMVLYIIHGWTYTTKHWGKTLAALAAKGITAKLLHVPGLTTASTKTYTIADYTKWADQSIPQNTIALGHSNGGRILMNLATKHPDKLRHLILLDSAGIYAPSAKARLLRPLTKVFAPLKKSPIARKILHKLIRASDYAAAPENMKKTLTNMLDSDKTLDPTRIKVPTSILWGAEDPITPPWQGKKLHEQIKNSTYQEFPGWDHAPYIKHPDQLAEQIAKIMGGIK